jgi:NADH-quinone oxidoreductase subunit L
MFMAASVGAYWVAIFHVVTHAFFKACLFLGAGSVIHGCHHEQDMRQMGGLLKLMPVTAITYAISTISIAGIYPLAGYQSKHAILHVLGDTTNPYLAQYSGLLVLLASAVAFMTAFYMARSFALTFLGKYRGHAHPHESPWIMTIPLIVLAFLAVVGGLAIETTLPQHLSAIMPIIGEQQRVTIVEGILLSWVGIFGVVLGLVLYTRLYDLPGRIYAFFGLFSKLLYEKYYIDQLYNRLIVQPLEKLSGFLYKAVDQGTIDATVNGAAAMAQINGEILKVSQSGQLKQYALYILIGAVLLLVFGFMF